MTLEIEAAADPIAGSVRVEEAPAHDFTGWVELARMVEETLAAARERLPPA